jgi:putative FmdB family regulatory protein
MATYEYWCPNCQKEFEVRRPVAEFDKPASCPDCGTEGQRLMSTFASKIDFSLQVPAKRPFRRKDDETKG